MKTNNINFKGLHPFELQIKYLNIDAQNPGNVHTSHIHDKCEIYINLSGDVSFIVENNIYPIKPGDIIITRPFEYHHCVYHSNKLHKHFWILFSSAGNEELLSIFFNRKSGDSNRLTLLPKDTEALLALCHRMTEKNCSDINQYYNFFKLMSLLRNADTPQNSEVEYPSDIVCALNHINSNFSQEITIKEIAEKANVSINTLERHFQLFFNQSPSSYIRKKRLANAARLLSEGYSVTSASIESGFSDYSNFIVIFKKAYGITPFKYKNSHKK